MAEDVLSVVETDLQLLAAEAKKAEGPMANLMGMLHHSELPAVKDATERALQKIPSMERGGLLGVQQALILAPFSLACETKYAKLACIALSAFQKLLANDAVSIRGRCEIIKALQAAERLSDESVKLRILQASLTIVQSPSFADEQDAVQQLLSVIFRIYVNNKSNFAVHSTAAATIRQAVALIFDHSIMKPQVSPSPTPILGSPNTSSPIAAFSTPLRSGYSGGGANTPGPPQAAAAASSTISASVSTTAVGEGGPPSGREAVPVLLLEEIMGWLGARDGKELGWIQLGQKGGNKMDRTFLLEMLEAVLLQRAAAIHRLPGLEQCLRTKVAPAVGGLLDSACDRMVDPNDALDCRLVVRCAAALVRRHHDLAPERAAAMVVRLAETAGSVGRPGAAHRWQRFMALQALRPLLADPPLLYRLYHMSLPADKGSAVSAGDDAAAAAGAGAAGGGNVLPNVVRCLNDALRWYVRTAIETPEDDVVAALGNLYLQRAMGARDSVQETEAFGTNLAHGSEVVIAHLALECVLAMVAATEALTDVVVVPAEPGMPSPKLITRDTPEVRCAAVAGLVTVLWRCVLMVCNTLLARAAHDVLVGLLIRGLQGITYGAGALGVTDARDALLHALCSHTLLPPGEDDMAVLAAAAGAASGAGPTAASASIQAVEDRSLGGFSRRSLTLATGVSASSTAATASSSAAAASSGAPGFLTAILVDRSTTAVRVVLTPRNIAALRSLFNLAHRLADGLGSSGWLYVVDAVNALDRILASPHTTTAAYLMEAANEVDGGAGLTPMTSVSPLTTAATGVGPIGTSTGGTAPAGGAGASGAAAGGPGALAPMASVAPGGLTDNGADDTSTTAQRELRILASAADQLFENTHHMSPEAVVSLLSALAEISHRTLSGLGLLAVSAAAGSAGAGGAAGAAAAAASTPAASGGGGSATAAAPAGAAAVPAAAGTGMAGAVSAPASAAAAAAATAGGPVRLCALNRMVDTLLHNLWRIQDLWGIFLAHVLEVLASNNVQVRAAAVDALDRTITGALNPDLHIPDKFTAPLPPPEDALSPGSAAAAGRRALLPTFPSFAITAGSPTPPLPPPQQPPTQQGASATTAASASASPLSGSRRSSRDMGPGNAPVYGSPPTVTSFSLQPPAMRVSTGGAAGSPATSFSQLVLGAPLVAAAAVAPPSTSPSASPFANSLSAATAAAGGVGVNTPPGCAAAAGGGGGGGAVAVRGVQQAAQREDVQHMLLVALDSLYREGGRSPDVRHGLLRIALHVLQHHGDGLTRGWVPMLRLLEAVPRGGLGPADVRLGFQVVELLATDYLASSLPKEHVAKALEVIAKFANQDVVLNVSLTSITMLWNVTDHLARSRGTFSKASSSSVASLAAALSAQPNATTIAQPPAPAQQAAAAAATQAPAARPTSVVAPSLEVFGGGAAGVNTPFRSTLYGNGGGGDSTASGERQMSPAFAAALSFARGVPALPSASSPDRSPWPTDPNKQQPQTPTLTPEVPAQRQEPQPLQPQPTAQAAPLQVVPPGTAGTGSSYPLHDLDEAESIAMLMIAFRSLKAVSVDPRPEARNAAVRTLFLAVGSHGGKFPLATWHELFWSLLFDLLVTIHRKSASSSVEEAAAVELGKERSGRSVIMLVHHSRNSEQKQWDETLVLALAGAAKVVRSYLGVLSGLDVWSRAWEELMQVVGDLLASGRKGVSMASTSLLITIMQAHGAGPLVCRDMWRQLLAAVDRGVATMAAPLTPAPLQARAELLSCITTLSSQLLLLRCRPAQDTVPTPAASTPPVPLLAADTTSAPAAAAAAASGSGKSAAAGAPAAPDPEHLMLVLRWLDRFARYPVGADDTSSIHFTTIGPIQKAALTALAALPPVAAATGTWPAVLSMLCNMLRPFSTLALRQHAQQMAALQQQRRGAGFGTSSFNLGDMLPPSATSTASALDPMSSFTSGGSAGSRDASAHGANASAFCASPSAGAAVGVTPGVPYTAMAEVLEARAMSPVWMARVVELLATWYRDHVSWQVRVATFPLLVGAMSECMACRHMLPLLTADPTEQLDDLWRTSARGFVTVVQTGLPSINICSSQAGQQQQVPHSTWPALARAFEMFFLSTNLPPLLQPPPEAHQALAAAAAAAASSGVAAGSATGIRRLSTSGAVPEAVAAAGAGSGSVPSQQQVQPSQPSTEQVAADLEITTAVLDCLSETVLSSCQHAPLEMRRVLIEVLDAGAASMATPVAAGIGSLLHDRPYDESALPATSRLSNVCLNKLYVLCSRGQEPPELDGREPPAARSQLEVAQLALPVFVSRCESILHQYTTAEQAVRPASATAITTSNVPSGNPLPPPPPGASAGTGADGTATSTAAHGAGAANVGTVTAAVAAPPRSTAAGSAVFIVPQALHDKARQVLELLPQLKVLPVVSDALLPYKPHLRFWLDVSRAVRAQAATSPPSLAAGAAAAAAATAATAPPAPVAHAGATVASSIAGASGLGLPSSLSLVLSAGGLSRRSSSGFEVLSPSVGPGSVAGDSVNSNGAPGFRAASSSFFSRTYSSTGALLSSTQGAATGSGSAGGGGGGAPPMAPSPKRHGAVGGNGGGSGATSSSDGRSSMSLHRSAPPLGITSIAPIAAGTGGGVGAVGGGLSSVTGKLQWAKEQPQHLALYGVLCDCIGSSDPVIRTAVQGMLTTLGGGVGLCTAPHVAPPLP